MISREGRGVAAGAILDAVKNPIKTTASRAGTTVFKGTSAKVVLNKEGKVVTAHALNRAGFRIPQ